jgi:hypothetical protein
MFFICWEKAGQRGWAACHTTKDIADVFVENDLVGMVDSVHCLDGGLDGGVMSYQQVLDAVKGKLPIKGAVVQTPRFLSVMLSEVFPSREAAFAAGFAEPTHFESGCYDVLGKTLGNNRMIFAAAMK